MGRSERWSLLLHRTPPLLLDQNPVAPSTHLGTFPLHPLPLQVAFDARVLTVPEPPLVLTNMKPTLMAIAAFVAVALGHGPVTTSSPSSTPAMTRATGKRDEPSQTSEVSTPAAPQIDNIFEIFDVFPEDILTEVLTGTVSTDSVTASSTGASATGTSDSSPTGLPNPASDSVWEDAASHGCRLFDAIRDSEEVAGQLYNPTKDSLQSILMSYESDFQGWGWNSDEIVGANFTDIDGGKKEPDPGWGIGDALRALGVSDKIVSQGGKNHVVDAIHGKAPFTQSYTKNGKTYPVCGDSYTPPDQADDLIFSKPALFSNWESMSTKEVHTCDPITIVLNTYSNTVLMALDRISPSSAGKKRNPPVSSDQLPDLSTFSDIGYLNYKHILGKDPSDFRYLMSLMITNEKTKSIIVKALQSTGKELGPWPGETFTWDSREFKALLGMLSISTWHCTDTSR